MPRAAGKLTWEICILAGGLSRRMGRDKARLHLGPRTMLSEIRSAAKQTGRPVRVLRRDALPRCGPLGGIWTALARTRSAAVLFLACDMPFVSPQLILHAIRKLEIAARRQEAKTRGQSTHQGPAGAAHAPPIFVFTRSEGVAGFPLALTRTCRAAVLAQIETGDFSLQKLARTLKVLPVPLPPALRSELRNVNTPSDWNRAQALWNHRQKH